MSEQEIKKRVRQMASEGRFATETAKELNLDDGIVRSYVPEST